MTAIATQRPALTVKQRWDDALKAVRSAGVVVKTNVNVCCHSCTLMSDLGLEEDATVPYAYFLRTQGRRVSFTAAGAVSKSTSDVVFFNWTGEAAVRLVSAFRAQGFEIDWDGTAARAVGIKLR